MTKLFNKGLSDIIAPLNKITAELDSFIQKNAEEADRIEQRLVEIKIDNGTASNINKNIKSLLGVG